MISSTRSGGTGFSRVIDAPEKVAATNSQQIASISFITVNGYTFLEPRELAHGGTSP